MPDTNQDQESRPKNTVRTNATPIFSASAAQASYTPERFKSGHRNASILTMVVLAAGCLVLGFLYYRTVKNLNSTNHNLATVKQQQQNLQSKLESINVPGNAASDSQVGITVKIPELGLQYQDTGQFSDLMWTLDYGSGANKTPSISISSKKIIDLHSKDYAKADNSSPNSLESSACDSANIGIISKLNKTEIGSNVFSSQTVINQRLKDGEAIDQGTYFLIYQVPQQPCSSTFHDVNSLQSEVVNSTLPKDFLKALQPIK